MGNYEFNRIINGAVCVAAMPMAATTRSRNSYYTHTHTHTYTYTYTRRHTYTPGRIIRFLFPPSGTIPFDSTVYETFPRPRLKEHDRRHAKVSLNRYNRYIMRQKHRRKLTGPVNFYNSDYDNGRHYAPRFSYEIPGPRGFILATVIARV